MPLFGTRRTHHTTTRTHTASRRSPRWRFGGRRDPDRVAGGYKAALSNPNTTHAGRRHAKAELKAMGRGRETHVGLMTRIKRTLGIRSTPRHKRVHTTKTTRRRHAY